MENTQDQTSFEVAPEHEEQEQIETETPEVRRSTRERTPPTWHSEYVTENNIAYCLLTEDGEPSTFREAIKSTDVSMWMTIMQDPVRGQGRADGCQLAACSSVFSSVVGHRSIFKQVGYLGRRLFEFSEREGEEKRRWKQGNKTFFFPCFLRIQGKKKGYSAVLYSAVQNGIVLGFSFSFFFLMNSVWNDIILDKTRRFI